MRTAGLILAERPATPLHIQRLVVTFHLTGVRPVVIVSSEARRAVLQKAVARMGVVFLPGEGNRSEMFDDVRTGLVYLQGQCERVLVTPASVPLFSSDTVRALLASGDPLAVPVCEARRGHPLLLAAELVPAILAYDGPDGLRGAQRACGTPCAEVPVADPGIHLRAEQIDADAAAAPAELHPVLKLRIARENPFLGPGSWQLLALIETTGSVRLASQQMGISYSKAWKLLDNLEAQVPFPVLVRRPGGKNGGETHLTPEGRAMLDTFERFENECARAVAQIFAKYYGDGALDKTAGAGGD